MKKGLIITTYNSENELSDLSKDICLYTQFYDEIIIVDDFSSDRTWEILNQVQYDFLKIIRLEKNSGRPSDPRNLGLKHLKSDYVTFLDIGDKLSLDYLNALTTEIELSNEYFYTGIKYKYKRDHEIELASKNNSHASIYIPSILFQYKMLALLSGLTVKTDRIISIKFEKQYFEDWIFVKQLLKNSISCKLILKPIYYKIGSNISKGKIRQTKRYILASDTRLQIMGYIILSIIKYIFEKLFKLSYNANIKILRKDN